MSTSHPLLDQPPEEIYLPITAGVGKVEAYARHGVFQPASGWFEQGSTLRGEDDRPLQFESYRWENHFSPESMQRLLAQIEISALEQARHIQINLSYGDTVHDIWDEHRELVEPTINALGLEQHMLVIRNGIRGDNPEGWRTAMYECRAVLEQLAAMLWRDERSKHPCLSDHKGSALDVGPEKTKNRLMAYLHCKGTKDNEKQAIEADLDAVLQRVRTLYDLDSTAHKPKPVDRDDSRLAVIQTYILLGQLVQRSDLQPVTDANECC